MIDETRLGLAKIGILQALGLRTWQVLGLFLGRAVLMGVLGSAAGLLTGTAAGLAWQGLPDGAEVSRLLDPWMALLTLLAAPGLAARASCKTTLLLIAAGLLHPDQGRVRIGGGDVYALSSEARARLRATQVGMVFQQYHLIPYLSVLENVLCPSLALPNAQAAPRAGALIERLGLAHRSRHLPGQLSLGERQRTALARALLNLPSLLLVDEPTGNLDPHNAAAILDCLAEFARNGGAVLMVTHDPAAARRADRVLRLADGAITHAPPEAAA